MKDSAKVTAPPRSARNFWLKSKGLHETYILKFTTTGRLLGNVNSPICRFTTRTSNRLELVFGVESVYSNFCVKNLDYNLNKDVEQIKWVLTAN